MKHKFLSVVGLMIILGTVSTALADRQTYTPPAEKGSVYIVVRYRQGFGPQSTQISVAWGSYRRSEAFRPPRKLLLPNSGIPEGFVLRLKHSKNDSVALTVETDGRLQQVYQGDPPGEWNQREYTQASW